MSDADIIEQLLQFYYDPEKEFWHSERMSRISAYKYYEKLLHDGNIITISDNDILCGYCEMYRLSYEQFGRIICGEPFSAVQENVLNGQIAYVANTYIRPEYRRGQVYRMLRERFFEFNKDCTHFCGIARRKKSAPVKVFRRSEIMSLNKVEV